jgi:hypothetical protein
MVSNILEYCECLQLQGSSYPSRISSELLASEGIFTRSKIWKVEDSCHLGCGIVSLCHGFLLGLLALEVEGCMVLWKFMNRSPNNMVSHCSWPVSSVTPLWEFQILQINLMLTFYFLTDACTPNLYLAGFKYRWSWSGYHYGFWTRKWWQGQQGGW